MNRVIKSSTTAVIAFLLGTLYAAFFGLFAYKLRAALISWPVWTLANWLLLRRFGVIRASGYLAAIPLSVLSLEIIRTFRQPPQYAFQLIALDRSHYVPGTRLVNRSYLAADSNNTQSTFKELYIGADGFRADPETGQGNPAHCKDVLIGDSMIYGHGLQYSETLRPVLAKRNIEGCVFGVAGNAPVDYLETLKFVSGRIDAGAHIAIYIYVYNDFVSLAKYLERTTRGISPLFVSFTGLINYYDDWRRATFVQAFLRRATTSPKPLSSTWRLKVSETKELAVDWPHDPSKYPAAPPLSREQRATFLFFLKQLKAFVGNRHWQVSIVFVPDNEEMLANLARPSLGYRDLDQRRIEAMKICVDKGLDCRDLSRYMFERAIAEGKSPYLLKDRHFSLFGNQILAEHYGSIRNRPELKAKDLLTPNIARALSFR